MLSYRYDPSTGLYSVIENRAFVNQIGRDWKVNHNALAQAPSEYGKPPANVLGMLKEERFGSRRDDHCPARDGL